MTAPTPPLVAASAAPAGTAPAIEVRDAHKTIDGVEILRGVSLRAQPGQITALLGPNGAGKSTLLRAIVGLVRLDAGEVRIGASPLHRIELPLRTVGALIDPDAVDGARSARGHLNVLAVANGLPRSAVDRALRLVGLADQADQKVRRLSLGTRQRLALAAALLGDPQVLILDEPHNGLDASAIRWLRTVVRAFAAAGRTVLLSSHLLAEVALVADHVVVVDDGRVVADLPFGEFAADALGLERRYLDLVGDR